MRKRGPGRGRAARARDWHGAVSVGNQPGSPNSVVALAGLARGSGGRWRALKEILAGDLGRPR